MDINEWAELAFWGTMILLAGAFLLIFIRACVMWMLQGLTGFARTAGKGVIALAGIYLWRVWTGSETAADFKLGMAIYFGVFGLACVILLGIIGFLYSLIPKNKRQYPRKNMSRKARKRYDEGIKYNREKLAELMNVDKNEMIHYDEW